MLEQGGEAGAGGSRWESQGARGLDISVKFKPEGYPVARE